MVIDLIQLRLLFTVLFLGYCAGTTLGLVVGLAWKH